MKITPVVSVALTLILPGIALAQSSTDPNIVHLATVTTVQTGGLLDDLIADFTQRTGYRVDVYAGEDLYSQARAGNADVVFSHFGHKDAEPFLSDGLGQWPHVVLANTIAFLVPPNDPARVRAAKDPVEAFQRIAQTKSPFIVNNIDGLQYLVNTLWNASGRPDKTGWYSDAGLQMEDAIREASGKAGYTLWGVSPFLEYQQPFNSGTTPANLQPVIFNDSLMQRIMVSIVVNPGKFPQANMKGALAFQDYLLNPETQARIRAFRFPGIDQPLFWPEGRSNSSIFLPR